MINESDMYCQNGPITTANIAPYVNDETGFVYMEESNGNTNDDSFIQAKSVESGDTYNNYPEFTGQVDSTGLNDFDFVQAPTTVIIQHSVESVDSSASNGNNTLPANLNPNVPEFVPTFAHGSCAESLNYDKKLGDDSDIEGIYT